jgi:cytochrome-b5 reductase
MHSLQPGEKLFVAAALQGYPWKTNEFPHITLIVGGAGVTPVYQLAQGIFGNPEEKTAITLIYGVNSDQDVLLKDEFEQFSKKFPDRFKAIYTVSHPSLGSPFRKGYVTKELLEEILQPERQNTKVFVCGPPAMETFLIGTKSSPGILGQIGYQRDQIFKF